VSYENLKMTSALLHVGFSDGLQVLEIEMFGDRNEIMIYCRLYEGRHSDVGHLNAG
jgi:hypothetical protein